MRAMDDTAFGELYFVAIDDALVGLHRQRRVILAVFQVGSDYVLIDVDSRLHDLRISFISVNWKNASSFGRSHCISCTATSSRKNITESKHASLVATIGISVSVIQMGIPKQLPWCVKPSADASFSVM